MKSFKEYLTESKKVYEFKIKIAGDCPKDSVAKIKEALACYKVESCSAGKSTPITEKQVDFPKLENVGATVFDIVVGYPTTNAQIREAVAKKLKIAMAEIRVRSSYEEEELALNHQYDEKSGKAYLGTDYEASDHQDLVGEQHKLSFLKDIHSMSRELEEVTGTNDQLFPKPAKGKTQDMQSVVTEKSGMTSIIGTKQNKLTPYANSVKNSLNVAAKGK
jgi:hypothetical protein